MKATAYARERTQERLVELCHSGRDLAEFFDEAGELLRPVVPFDGFCSMSLDPATLLPTSHFTHNSMRPEDVPRLAANEYTEEDFNKMAELARAPRPAAGLSEATGGALERSRRYCEILSANGFGDELRLAARDDAPWACFAFYRAEGEAAFGEADADFVADVSAMLAEGVRRAILLAAAPTEEGPDAPGLILLDRTGAVDAVTPSGERWLREMITPAPAQGRLPQIVNAVVYRTLLAAEGGSEGMARARVPTSGGRWVVLHGSLFGDADERRVAVIIEPARSPEIAPLIADAYDLSEREREVTRLVLQGLSTSEIAGELHVSPYTVQDHLKSIFEKMGVHSRREVAAKVFFQHYGPRLAERAPIGSHGWFAEPPTS
ncbi:MAG TPA: helix-turn-helix transcriptional regulator [Gaiellaceae bacterium]|nr:helix-turn-helix transcriptional regulator [Gaiellaceae bacterium]